VGGCGGSPLGRTWIRKRRINFAGGECHGLLALATIGTIVPSIGRSRRSGSQAISRLLGEMATTMGYSATDRPGTACGGAERALGIDDPIRFRRSGARYAANALRVFERGVTSRRTSGGPASWAAISLLQEQPAKQAREHARHRQEEAGPARPPNALAVERDAAARYDHVDVRMMGHGRTPGMENRR